MTAALKIGVVAKEVLMESGEDYVVYGCLDTIHEIHNRMGWKSKHPMTANDRVLTALDAHCDLPESLFVKHYGRWGLRGQSCRGYWLKKELAETKQ